MKPISTPEAAFNEIASKAEEVISAMGRTVEILEEALSGTSPKSKNTLIKEAIKILK